LVAIAFDGKNSVEIINDILRIVDDKNGSAQPYGAYLPALL